MNPAEKKDLFELIEGCIKNERRCQQKIYETFYGKMKGICLRYARDNDEAQDIVQDGFIKVFNNIKNFGNNGSFEGWVRRIMVNTAIDSYRKNRSSLLHADSEYIENIKEEPEEETTETITISTKEVLAKVQLLSPAYKTVFNMYVLDGYTHKEIAESLGISEGTSKSNLAKAKMNLRKALNGKKNGEV